MSQDLIDYKKLFEDSPLPRLIVSQKQKDHFFVETANKAALDYFCPKTEEGYSSIDGMYLADFLDSANKTHILQALTVCFESQIPIFIQVVPKLPGRMQVQSFMISPIFDETGDNVTSIDMLARPPASDQAAVERERDDAISMFTSVFDISDVGFTVTDHHGRFVRLNDCFYHMTGWQPIDLIGEKLTKIIPQDEHEKAWERHSAAIASRKKNFGEINILKKNGEIMSAMVTSLMMELSNGRSFRITTVVDVSDLKQIERDLRRAKNEADEANMAKSAFLANMSHELRTPLNAIIGFSEMMINSTLGPIENDNYVEYLGDIKFSAQHLLQIINDVLDMSKIEAGKMPLDEEAIHIEGLLKAVKRLMSTKAEENNIEIKVDVPENTPLLKGDERLIRQVFLNLLSNAVKFSKPDSDVVMKLEYDEQIRVSVIDHGIGIPQDRIDEVVEPFGQVSDPRVNKGQGTGLGLPIAKAMMDMHGGGLEIKSEKDKGTIITCIFPANRAMNKIEEKVL